MRTFVRPALVAIAVACAGIGASQQPPPEIPGTVWVTPSGEKYHKRSCQYTSMKATPLALEDAKAKGYEPCKRCQPPK